MKHQKQQGVTLIVSLILLLVLTLLGLSVLDSVSLQSSMARNSQFQIHSYQLAMSEINAQLLTLETDIGPLNSAIVNGVEPQTGNELAMTTNKFTQTVNFNYVGEGLPPPGYSVDSYIGRIFELNSRAQVDNTGVFSDQTQGLNYAGPK